MTTTKRPTRDGGAELRRKRRDKGLCTHCGEPAEKSARRGKNVNQRLARGGGLPDEYVRATKGRWKAGDPPPTIEYLTHKAFCTRCKDNLISKTDAAKANAASKAERRLEQSEASHRAYRQRIESGRCGRCGKHPLPKDGTKQCNTCKKRHEERALASTDADAVMSWLKAGESQTSIRTKRGIKRGVIEPLAQMLQRRGELAQKTGADKAKRTATTGGSKRGTPEPTYDDGIATAVAMRKDGKTYEAIADACGTTSKRVRRWLRLYGFTDGTYEALIDRVTEMRENGTTIAAIARTVGKSNATIQNWIKRAGLAGAAARPRAEAKRAEALRRAATGESQGSIARSLKVSRPTIGRWLAADARRRKEAAESGGGDTTARAPDRGTPRCSRSSSSNSTGRSPTSR